MGLASRDRPSIVLNSVEQRCVTLHTLTFMRVVVSGQFAQRRTVYKGPGIPSDQRADNDQPTPMYSIALIVVGWLGRSSVLADHGGGVRRMACYNLERVSPSMGQPALSLRTYFRVCA